MEQIDLQNFSKIIFREAQIGDISQIQFVRHSVKENTLSDPAMVTDEDVKDYVTCRGKGWVCVVNDRIVGFSIVSLTDHNVWALFIQPEFERMKIGKQLHDVMLDWYFSQTAVTIWLGTEPRTRAEAFYRKAGWIESGIHAKGEIKFEMTKNRWLAGRG